ncbi:MAG: aminopeptidase [Candidatus Cloacimonadales bacterium]
MLKYQKLLNNLNQAVEAEYLAELERIKEIWEESKESDDKYLKFAFAVADKILALAEMEKTITENYYQENSFEDLQKNNQLLFEELWPENYSTSYANPDYACQQFGEELGQVFSAFYTNVRSLLDAAYSHEIFSIERYCRKFIQFYTLLKAQEDSADEYRKIYRSIMAESNAAERKLGLIAAYDPHSCKFSQFIQKADLHDLRYLYQFGKHISANEIETAKFLSNYPPQKIDKLAASIVEAYIRSFTLSQKDLSNKKTVTIMHNIGQELIVRQLMQKFAARGLQAIVNNPFSTAANRQYQYDHRFDKALYFDEEYTQKYLQIEEEVSAELQELLAAHFGPVYFDKFGETPFSPQQKKSCLKLKKQQQKLNQTFRIEASKIREKYSPRQEGSFCIIAFPVPEIGQDFAKIFEETMENNMIDSEQHEAIQHHLITELDKAEYVHVLGKEGNKTDIKVKMQKLKNPAQETNFVNCGAEVNIPVGEVFTSPQLTGTNGILHVKEIYLNDLRYENLELEFVDGYVKNYNCTNFAEAADNRNFIEENLLFPHKTLPLGEFAIGTNTKAYVMSQRYEILPIMPILIVEKMGPHFAIGDTCFSWEEDFKVYPISSTTYFFQCWSNRFFAASPVRAPDKTG